MKIFPNDLCLCGSGKKYKKCCMHKGTNSLSYIRQQLKNFNEEFVGAVIRVFNTMVQEQESDGCLSNSAALYIIAKKYGYDAEICYGLCELDGKQFYHAWLEINGLVIDLAIYGNVNYGPFSSVWPFILETPFIGAYESSFVKYGKYQFDEDWHKCNISIIENKTLTEYMDGLPLNGMWILTCIYLGIKPSRATISDLRPYAAGVIFDKSTKN